jgi:hypothetical protein
VIVAIVVTLPIIKRPVALPVLAKLVVKGHELRLAAVAGPPDGADAGRRAARPLHVFADAAYAG